MRFKKELPEKFTYPFRYKANPLVVKLAEGLSAYIAASPELSEAFAEGKMLGILLVENKSRKETGTILPKAVEEIIKKDVESYESNIWKEFENVTVHQLDDETAFLAAFSGNVGGRNRLGGFVPPILDLLDPKGYFKLREAEISAINQQIRTAVEAPQGALGSHSKLGLESADSIEDLKAKRKAMSDELQKWIFDNYIIHNALGESLSIREIFTLKGLVPPAGTGDCAAPKLLNYAFTHGLKPLAMGEFRSDDGKFHPSCSSKCGPLLRWMLQGLKVDCPYEFDDSWKPDIVWEDEHFYVVNKPAGMLCAPGKDGQMSLIERMPQPAYSVHRLDMDTSGLILVAKSLRIQKELRMMFENREIVKSYIALLENNAGLKEGDKGQIELPIRPDIDNRPKQMVDFVYGKPALTYYEVEIQDAALVLVRFRPHTGRTHQLRIHAAEGLGCPIIGDLLYGAKEFHKRLCLHAESLKFEHPISKKRLFFEQKQPFFALSEK